MPSRSSPSRAALLTGGAVAAGLAAAALITIARTRKAERDNPPRGRFVAVRGVRLHYVERGRGEPVVLLHGNGSMVQDFETSGLVAMAARTHRVIAFDRPGYGWSERPRGTIWTPDAQAALIGDALRAIGIERAIVVGHSWGTLVAVALASRFPGLVAGLVLASGYYYPSVRADVVLASGPAVPGVGDLARFTVSPLVARLLWPLLLRKIFGPAPVPAKFDRFPSEMALRPSAIRASAAEAALMIPAAATLAPRYADLTMPVAIVAGDSDRLIDTEANSGRLHRALPHSTFDTVPGAGHMVHQTAPGALVAAIRRVEMEAWPGGAGMTRS